MPGEHVFRGEIAKAGLFARRAPDTPDFIEHGDRGENRSASGHIKENPAYAGRDMLEEDIA